MNIILYMLVVLYVGSITANMLNIYLNYKRAIDFAKMMEKGEKELLARKEALADEIDRFNEHVAKLNMTDFSVDNDKEGVKH